MSSVVDRGNEHAGLDSHCGILDGGNPQGARRQELLGFGLIRQLEFPKPATDPSTNYYLQPMPPD